MGTAKAAGLVVLLSALAVVSIATAIGARAPASATAVLPISRPPDDEALHSLASRRLLVPVDGVSRGALRDNFDELRGKTRRHEALDIMAPRGTPVHAVDAGRVAKLLRNAAGGITLYQFDPDQEFTYYYAHLDRYAEGIVEGAEVKRGDVIGYVGSTGNAPAHAPHLHFTIFALGPDARWWKGRAVNPYPFLAEARAASPTEARR